MFRRFAAIALLSLVLAACQQTSSGPTGPTDEPPPPGGGSEGDTMFVAYDLSPEAELIDEATLAALTSFDPDAGVLVFGSVTDQLQRLEAGDILLAGASENAPDGLLQRVVAVDVVGGSYVVRTEVAALEEAFDNLDVDFVQALDFDDVVATDLPEGVSLSALPVDVDTNAERRLSMRLDLDSTLYSSSAGQVISRGHVDFGIGAFATLKIRKKWGVPTGVKRFDIGFNVDESVHLRLNADFDGLVFDHTVSLGTIRFKPICAGVVCFSPALEFYVRLDGRVSASLSFEASQELFFQVGARYSGGKWSNLSAFDHSFQAGLPVSELRETDTRGIVGVEAKLCLYGYCGASAGAFAELYLRFIYDESVNPVWELRTGLDVGIRFVLRIKIIITLLDESYEKRWNIFERTLRRANFVPEVSLVRPASTNQRTDVIEGEEDAFSVTIRDTDGPVASNPIAVRWESDVDGLLQEANATMHGVRPNLQFSAFRAVGDLSVGDHTITVRATDRQGDSGHLRFDVRVLPATAEPQILSIWAEPNPVPVGGTTVISWELYQTDRLIVASGGEALADVTNATSYTTGPITTATTFSLRAENAVGTSNRDIVVDVLPVEVVIDPVVADVFPGRERAFRASVTGAVDGSVSWGASCGSLASAPTSVVFTAPDAAGPCEVWATSVADPASRASATVNVLSPPPTATVIAAGAAHSLALTTSGAVYAWGDNRFGQVGVTTFVGPSAEVCVAGDGSAHPCARTPVMVPGITNARAVAAGPQHSLALGADGRVLTWGTRVLSDGSRSDLTTPVVVSDLSGAVAIAAGGGHSLVVLDDGSVWAWGRNDAGQLGNGSILNSTNPVLVVGLDQVIAVAASEGSSYALRSDGSVWAWGDNARGQLGDGTTAQRTTPVRVNGLSNVMRISANGRFALALDAAGTIWAWGSNSHNQLGNEWYDAPEYCGQTTSEGACSRTPIRASSATFVNLDAGVTLFWAVTDEGRAYRWGGSPTMVSALGNFTPIDPIAFLAGVTSVAVGGQHGLALHADGLSALGANDTGQLGDGTNEHRSGLVTVLVQGVGAP